MDTLEYKGYVIRAQPQPVKDSEDWTVQIHIERKGPTGLNVRPRGDTDPRRFDRCPDVDVRVAANKNVGVANSPGDPLFL